MSVTALISLGDAVYPAVPNEAIVNNGGNDYVFILTNNKVEEHKEGESHEGEAHEHEEKEHKDHDSGPVTNFERVQVIRGASDVGYTEIKPVVSLQAGTQIVVKGAFFLMAKMTNAGEAHEH